MKLHPSFRSLWLPVVTTGLMTASVLNGPAAGIENAWTNAAGNLLWSNPLNWVSNVVPGSIYSARFNATQGTTNGPGLDNNIVDADTTVQQLFYNPIIPAYHTTLINPGVTLSVQDSTLGNDILGLRAGAAGSPNNALMHTAIRGGGRLVVGDVNSPPATGNIRISNAASATGPYWATLDMSGLDYFECSVGDIRVGASGSSAGTQGTWIMAKTNLIVVGSTTPGNNVGFALGVTTTSVDYPSAGDVQLGQENVFRMHTLRVGGSHATNATLAGPGGGIGGASQAGAGGAMEFQTGLNNPTLTLRYIDGSTALNTLAIGDNFYKNVGATSTNTSTGVLDLTGGSVDMLVDNVFVGRSVNATGGSSTRRGDGKGTLTWTAGDIQAASVSIGLQAANNLSSATGVVNVFSNATLFANNISVGRDQGTASGTANGTLNIAYGGTVTLTNHLREDSATINGTSRVNLTNGTLTVRGSTRVDHFTAQDSVLNLDIVAAVNNSNPDCDVTNLTLIGSVTLNVSGSGLTLASYPLFKYKGSIGGDGFAALTLGSQPVDTQGYLFNNTANNSIDLVITNVPAAKWDATVNNDWDIGTTNWVSSVNNAPVAYTESSIPGDVVIFDDSPAGAVNTVNLTTVLSPTLVILNNSEPYSFIGTGQISGPGGLIKNGSGTLTIANSGVNDYTGATTVAGGTLLVNGTVQSSSSVTVQAGGTLGGTGTIASPVTISSAGTLAAGNSIGTLTVNNNLTLSAGSSNIFEVNSDTLTGDLVAVAGGVVTYGGNLVLSFSGGGTGLTNGAAIPLFTGAAGGTFDAIIPPFPAVGLIWDQSTMTSDGMLRILPLPLTPINFTWTNVAGGNLLWSNPANWDRVNPTYPGNFSPTSIPTFADKVIFTSTNNGAIAATNVQGAVNNIVGADMTVTNLMYNSIAPEYHTTLINPGVTLSVQAPGFPGGDFFGLRVALPDEGDSGAQVHAAIRGEGRLIVGDTNNPGPAGGGFYMRVMASLHPPGTYWGTFDMSGLNYFECGLSEIRVGSSGTSAGTHGTWRMAKTNLIVLGQTTVASGGYFGLSIGFVNTSADYTGAGDVQLGQENVLLMANVTVGGARATNHTLGGPGGGIGGASQAGAGGTMEFQTGLVNPTLTMRGTDGFSPTASIAIGDNSNVGTTLTTNTATGVLDLTGGTVDVLVTDLFVGRANASASATRNGGGKGTLTWTAGTVTASSVSVGAQTVNTLGTATGVVNVQNNAVLDVQGSINIGADAGSAAGTGNGTLNIVAGGVASVIGNISENNAGAQSGSSTINVTNGYLVTTGEIVVDNVNVISGTISNAGPLTAGTVSGGGVIAGPVTVTNLLLPGASIGTLTIYNSLTLGSNSTNVFEVNTDTLAHDLVTGLTSVTYGGTLAILPSGFGTAITNGASAQLFSAASYNGSFAAIVPATPGPGLAWNTNQLTVNGTLTIVAGVSTTPTNLTFAVSGNSLNISWPASHTGWRLEAQTNSINVGISNNWFTVAGSTTTNQVFMPVNPANGAVFYRLIYP